jgi:hypothetical protein
MPSLTTLTLGTYRREDHHELDSIQIQAALDQCAASGGGIVRLLPGTYRCGTLHLRSSVTLHLERGAMILGSPRLADYPMPATPFVDAVGHTRGRALLIADRVSDFALTGEGIIDGNGGSFFPSDPDHRQRPFLLRLVDCSRLSLRGLTLRNAAAWTVHLLNCTDATLEDLVVDSRVNENNDGIDIDSCRRVIVRRCEVNTDDDAICLKSTRPEACEDIEVHDCTLSTECSALKLGTESYGDIRRVRLHDCRVRYAATGAIKLLTSDGGFIEDVEIRDIVIERGTGPVFLRLGHRARTYAPGSAPKGPGRLRRVRLSRIRATVFTPPKEIAIPFTGELMPAAAFSGMLLTGLPEQAIEDVTLEDCDFTFVGGFSGDPATLQPPEQPAMYPEHFYFGTLPGAAAFYRHVRGLTLRGVRFTLASPDSRPLVAGEDVTDYRDDSGLAVSWRSTPASRG